MVTPRVSVVIPAFNVERFIGDAIESILMQTLADFELIVVDDGSTDRTMAVVSQFKDPRIHIIKLLRNSGPGRARNEGIDAAAAGYVAFLDGDDIAAPTRLEEQLQALDAEGDLVLVGSWLEVIWEDGQPAGETWYREFEDDDETAIALLFRNTMHSAVMVRKSALESIRYQDLPAAEDYDFAVRLARVGKLRHVPKALTRYRMRSGSRLRSTLSELPRARRRIVTDKLAELGIAPTERELEVNRHVGTLTLPNSEGLLEEVEVWLLKLHSANRRLRRFDQHKFECVVGKHWFEVCKFASNLGWRAWRKHWSSPLGRLWKPPLAQTSKFALKCVLRHKRLGGNRPPLH